MSRLYAFGSNGSGQLGIGTMKDTSFCQRCLFDGTDELPVQISRIVAGGNHTLVLLKNGDIYSSEACYEDGQDDHDDPKYVFHKRLHSSKIKLCSALWEASVVVDDKDQIFSHGKGPNGELGTGAVDQPVWQKITTFPPSGTHIVDLASGIGHTIAVLSNGEVYGWGNGRKGQIGEPAEIVQCPRKIQNLAFSVKRAVCGREFTYLVGEPAEGCHTVIGSNKWNVRSDAPSGVLDWTDIGASWGSIFVLKVNGKIVSWGRNDHGQLTRPVLPHVKHMATGSEHVLVLTNRGDVLGRGWGEHGNCGPNTDKAGDVKNGWDRMPKDPEVSPQVVGVGAGCATSFYWTKTIEIGDSEV